MPVKLSPKMIVFALLLLIYFNSASVHAEDAAKKTVLTEEANTSAGRIEGPRDVSIFAVEPAVLDERHYLPGLDIWRPTEDQRIRSMLKRRAGLD